MNKMDTMSIKCRINFQLSKYLNGTEGAKHKIDKLVHIHDFSIASSCL